MSLSKLQIVFRDSRGKEWETHTQALIATALQESIYLEDYYLRKIVEIISEYFYVREKKDETKRAS